MSERTSKRKSQSNLPEEEPANKTSKEGTEESIFSKPWQKSDAVLIVENKELHVPSATLSQASPVFQRMFNGSFKEAETKRVTLEGKSYEMVEHILRII